MGDAYQEQVRRFHLATGQPAPAMPTMPDAETRALRVRLMLEEVLEYARASGFEVQVDGAVLSNGRDFELLPFLPDDLEPDLADMAHEATDVLYVALGALVAMGAPAKECFDEVSAANLRKAPGGKVARRHDGKVLKPEGWQPADVGAVLAWAASVESRLEVNDQCPACNNPAGIPAMADGSDSAFNCAVCGERLNTRMDTADLPIRVWLVTESSARARLGSEGLP